MAFFPDQIMPKALRKETSKEVDDSPLIYNARDYNIHHREIRAIERFLAGLGGISSSTGSVSGQEATGVPDSSSNPDSGTSAVDVVVRFNEILNLLTSQGFMGTYAGTVSDGSRIILPSSVLQTKTRGAVSAAAATIAVESTAGFPESGVITKFNRLGTEELCTDGSPPGGGSRCDIGSVKIIGYEGLIGSGSHATNQEVITYSSKTATTFEGCVRSVNGTTAQDVASTAQAARIVNGRAAVSFGHNAWNRGVVGSPNQFVISHDADLKVTAQLLARGSRTRTGDVLDDVVEISWMFTVVGQFDDIDVSRLFNVAE